MSWFPLFIDLNQKNAVIFGAGKIAARRTKVLLQFGCRVLVISPSLSESMQFLKDQIEWKERSYRVGDCRGAFLVIAATNDREVNQLIGKECHQLEIPVSVADCRKESTFYFPAVIEENGMLAGMISQNGENHRKTAIIAHKLRNYLSVLEEATDENIEGGKPRQ